MISKKELDNLVKTYETPEFIKSDPIQFPHRYNDKTDIELAGFISSIFSYGNRKLFIKKLDELFNLMENEPSNFIRNGDFGIIQEKNIYYRFYTAEDIVLLFRKLSKLYNTSKGLSELFETNYKNTKDTAQTIRKVVQYFHNDCKNTTRGFNHMLPTGENCTLKRMNMFLRWQVRKSCVDLGVWNFIPTSELLIPLDVHVARLSREMKLLDKKTNTIKTVKELTTRLKEFDSDDPVKYDFAIFGKGIEESQLKKETIINKF